VPFAVDDIDGFAARLRARGAELVGAIENYCDTYRLCYVRGPEAIIVDFRRIAHLRYWKRRGVART
jgi:hypothetical protein